MLKRIKNLFKKKTEENELSVSEKIDNLFEELCKDSIQIYLGEDLINFQKDFCDIIQELREEIKNECGFILPQIHLQEGYKLQENEFEIYVLENLEGHGFLIPNTDGIRDEFYETLKTVVYDKMNILFTNDIAERYIEIAQRKNGWLIWNISRVLSVSEIKIILSELINSGKSICNIGWVFEKIGDEVLLNGGYQDCFCKKYNPRAIAKQVAKTL